MADNTGLCGVQCKTGQSGIGLIPASPEDRNVRSGANSEEKKNEEEER